MTDYPKQGKEPAKILNCPICRKPGVAAYKPFCSSRCADVDLGRWFSGSYAAAAVESPDDEMHADEFSED